jgi:hypothetical protein
MAIHQLRAGVQYHAPITRNLNAFIASDISKRTATTAIIAERTMRARRPLA